MTMKLHRKAYGFFIRYMPLGKAELLVYATSILTLRLPGGTVDEGEDLLEGLHREVQEETGIGEFIVLRELGVHRYYKPDVDKHVERHDYLLQARTPLPDRFSFTVKSHDKDEGLIFEYQWIGAEELHRLDWEFIGYATPEYMIEFFIT
jgi:8-oxo-dGTP pyrophosphatase MutT (NUDIX family)